MIKTILFAGAGALALAACSGSAPDATATQDPAAMTSASEAAPSPSTGEAAATTPAVAAAVPGQPPVAPPPIPVPPLAPATVPPPTRPLPTQEEKSEKGARAVLQTWARALETHQFGLAWEQFGSPLASRAAYAQWWQRYRTIRVSLGTGVGDAGMGSIYYTVPATLTGTTTAGKPFRLRGDVMLRRVNDVDGATPEQLRWHIGSADLKDVPTR